MFTAALKCGQLREAVMLEAVNFRGYTVVPIYYLEQNTTILYMGHSIKDGLSFGLGFADLVQFFRILCHVCQNKTNSVGYRPERSLPVWQPIYIEKKAITNFFFFHAQNQFKEIL